jgi:arylsulfatase A-like enzyme
MSSNISGLFALANITLFGISGLAAQNAPNIIYILADDLGYGDLGCYGQKMIETPNIDKLAACGIRFTQHYSGAPVCAPSRCVLLTGKHMGHSFIRGNDEWDERGKVWDYKAMISYLDEQVGMLVKQLKDLGIYENTLIIFTSDNGPTYNGGTDSPWFNSAGPFKSEFGWGKGFTHEGGVRVPMIANWPAIIKNPRVSNHISAFWDVLPTFCEIAGIKIPKYADGISFLPELKGKQQQKHKYLYWEFPETGGQQAVRMKQWKGIRENISKGNLKIELFNLDNDIQEMNDVSAKYPEIVKQMERIMVKEHIPAVQDRFKMKALGD